MAPKIAIIGAGPAGLTVTNILKRLHPAVDVTVFEKAASPVDIQATGGTLDLHEETGLDAIRAAGLWDRFQKYARYKGQDLVIADKHAHRLVEAPSEGRTDRPEIDRGRLAEILLENIPEESIRWGACLKSVAADGTLHFDHGTEGPFDLTVGADGVWSKVRQLISDIQPSYAGIGGFELLIRNPAGEHQQVSQTVDEGSYMAYSDCKALQAQRQGNGDIRVYSFNRKPEDYPPNLWRESGHDGVTLKTTLLETFYSDWAPELQAWIQACAPDVVRLWSTYELPAGMSWEHKTGLTLIGDAGHVMSPFAGEGVNMAMKDALELAETVAKALDTGSDLDAAVEKFEQGMFERIRPVAEETLTMKALQFQEDAPLGFVRLLKQLLSGSGREGGGFINGGS